MVFQQITEFLDVVNSGEDTVVFGKIFDKQKTKFCKYQLLFLKLAFNISFFLFQGSVSTVNRHLNQCMLI